MLSEKRQKFETKPNAIKVLMSMRRSQRSTTEHKQFSLCKTDSGEERNLLELIQKSKDFTAIFTKHKRSEYSGYKQINMNKSKIIKFENEHKEISRYQTPRKYQMNLKNIAKLRKRYSLEPSHFKQTSKDYKKYFIQSAKSAQRNDLKTQQIYSDRKCEKQLKEIIRQMNTSKHFSAQRKLTETEKEQSYTLEQSSKKMSTLIGNIYDDDFSLQPGDKEPSPNKSPLKLSMIQIKKGIKNRLKYQNQQKRQINLLKTRLRMDEQQQENLCGWQTQSFYPKKKNYFFETSKLCK